MRGTISNYFSKLACTKEWSRPKTTEGGDGWDGNDLGVCTNRMRKRKMEDGGDGMELKTTPKVARTMPGTRNDDLLDGTTSSGVKLVFMGAKSSLEREPDDYKRMGANDWLGISGSNGMETLLKPPGELKTTTRNI